MRERERERRSPEFVVTPLQVLASGNSSTEAVKKRHLPSFTRSNSTQGPVSGKTLLTAAEEEKAELEKAEKQRKPHPCRGGYTHRPWRGGSREQA